MPAGTARWVYADGTNVVDGISGPLSPSANDAQALGFSGTAWADLFLASGGVINWNAGNVTLTQSANALAFAGVTSGVTFDGALSNTAGGLASSSTAAGTLLTLTSTDAGATSGPNVEMYRNSASPAVNDVLGVLYWYGKDGAGNKQEYASIEAVITDTTSTSEDGVIDAYVVKAGARTRIMTLNAAGTAFSAAASYFFDTYVLKPNSPFFFATRGSADTGPVTIANYTEVSDRGSNFNPTTGVFTAPIAGSYHFDVQLINQNAAASIEAEIWVNGATASLISFAPSAQMCVSINANIVLALNDTVSVRLISGTTQAAGAYNRFSGFMVG